MLCQNCGSNEATAVVHVLEGTEKKDRHLCSNCLSALINTNLAANPFSPLQFFSGFFAPHQAEVGQDIVCEHCGTSFQRFRETGRFGCAHCYDSFGDRLDPIFRKIQYGNHYSGKAPQAGKGTNSAATLKRQLEEAVAREDYERAAALKKEIDKLKGGMEK